MPAQEWKSDSVDGALLFILFIERIFHPNSFSGTEIYDHPSLPFKNYPRKKFGTYCTTAANRCLKFERTGTGLTKAFKEFIKEARDTYGELINQLKSGEEGVEEEDEDYIPGEEEEHDIPLDPDFEDESIRNHKIDGTSVSVAPTNIMRQTRADAAKPINKKTSQTVSAVASGSSSRMTHLKDPYVLPYPSNDKIFCQLPMNGNVDEDDDFKVEIQPRRVLGWVRVPSELEDAYELLGDDGRLTDNKETCPHCIIFQAEIDKRMKDTIAKRDEKGHLWVLEHDLALPFEVMLKYYDKFGMEMGDFMIQTNGLGYYYAQFWLKSIPKNHDKTTRTNGRRVGKAKKAQQWYVLLLARQYALLKKSHHIAPSSSS